MVKKRDATERLWKDLSGRLRSFIRRRVPEADVDDVLQESFIKIHDKMGGLKNRQKVVSWIYQVVRNTIVDHLRRRRPFIPLDEGLSVAEEPAAKENFNQTVGRWLTGMVDDLPPLYRDAVRLVELEGVSQKEASRRLGLSVSGAKSRAQRGRKMLKTALARCCHVELGRRGDAVDIKPRRASCCK